MNNNAYITEWLHKILLKVCQSWKRFSCSYDKQLDAEQHSARWFPGIFSHHGDGHFLSRRKILQSKIDGNSRQTLLVIQEQYNSDLDKCLIDKYNTK